ncbi:MAG: hypothetical protein EA341_00690 [Mongoliibacter sp.]|nr:MAG: hypothetical protein EA341_00690 [Mongoliibacter sp.]
MVYLLLVNFINLSANFYHSSVIDSPLLENHDPIDSLAELVLEYVFEMDDETIPDTEVPHEKKKFSDIKLHLQNEGVALAQDFDDSESSLNTYYLEIFKSISKENDSPPPQLV